MNKLMTNDEVYSASNIKTFELNENEKFPNDQNPQPFYLNLAKDLTTHIDSLNLNVNKTKEYNNLLRIGKK